MGLRVFRNALSCSLVLLLLRSAGAAVVTNESLYADIRKWEEGIRSRNAAQVSRQIEEDMEQGSRWSLPVLQGDGWAYSWGYLACLTHAWAMEWSGNPLEAYHSLHRAQGLQPSEPPPENHYYYWRWFLSMGELCGELSRFQDAEWYLQQVRQHLTTNDGFYIKATASLASILDHDGRLDEAYVLYDELIRLNPEQPPSVWNDYIRFLFDCGFFEEGVEAILLGAEVHGLSPRHRQNDYFATAARRYWHFFSTEHVVRWYALLGHLLDTTRLERGSEDHLAFLINTRMLMKKTYPDLLRNDRDDLAVLRSRSEEEIASGKGLRSSRHPGGDAVGADHHGRRSAPTRTGPSPSLSNTTSTNVAMERAVNQALLRTLAAKKRGEGEEVSWRTLLETYGTNELNRVVVDGVSGLFLAYAGLGSALAYDGKPDEAAPLLLQACAAYPGGHNPSRFGDTLLQLATVYLTRDRRDANKARDDLLWAQQVGRGNRRLEARVLDGLAGVEVMEEGSSDRRIPLLRRIVDNYGCIPRRNVYERLARDYYRTGEFAEGFNTYIEGIRRTRFKMGPGMQDHMVDGLIMNRSLHTAGELRRLREVLKAGAMRYAATLEDAPPIARMFDLSGASWIDEHEALAELDEAATYASSEAWSFITNTLHRSPSVRGGILYTESYAARRTAPDTPMDSTGWLTAWGCIRQENTSGKPDAPTDSGGVIACQELLLDQLEQHADCWAQEDMDKIGDAIAERCGDLSMEQFDRITAFFADQQRPDNIFDLHLARMRSIRNTAVDNPSFRAMFGLYEQVSHQRQAQLVDLLKLKRDEAVDPRLKLRWEQALRSCKS